MLDVLQELYAQTELDALRGLMLRLVSRLVPNEWASFNEFARTDYRSIVNIRIPDAVEIQARAPGLLASIQEHPAMKPGLVGSLSARTISDFLPWRDFQQTRIFNEYYRHVGVRHQLFFNFDGGQGAWRGIALNRKHRDFSDRDRSVLSLVSPHFKQAHAIAARMERLHLIGSVLSNPPVTAAETILILRADDRIESLSEPARNWIQNHWGVALTEGALPPEILRQWMRREKMVRPQSATLAEPRPPLQLSGATGLIAVHFVANDADGGTILFLRSAAQTSPVSQSKFPGLTLRENEVLHWIAQGKSNPEIATILGLSVRTVYKHVENLFAKMGVESRAQAMVRALETRP